MLIRAYDHDSILLIQIGSIPFNQKIFSGGNTRFERNQRIKNLKCRSRKKTCFATFRIRDCEFILFQIIQNETTLNVLVLKILSEISNFGNLLRWTVQKYKGCLLYTSPSPRDGLLS